MAIPGHGCHESSSGGSKGGTGPWPPPIITDKFFNVRFLMSVPVFSSNNTTEVSGEAFLGTSNVVKLLGGRDSAPDPAGGAYSAPPDLLAGGDGAGCPSPRTPPPLSAFQTSSFGPLSLASQRFLKFWG